ncbi:Uncharacterized protein HZ326_15975 [Fusarium oxysporum f. sp. albedinis]|nr:Uncharacterized protein HZ326_15975 [Fusarium oxysporum f. sp. albedinis]
MTQSCSVSLYLIRFLVLRFIIHIGNKSGSESQPPLVVSHMQFKVQGLRSVDKVSFLSVGYYQQIIERDATLNC